MKLNAVLLTLTLSTAGTVLFADLGDASKLPPPAKQANLSYQKDIQPLVEKACLNCHSGERPKSKYTMETRETLLKGGSSKEAAVVVGNSAKSPLVHYAADLVEELEMPPLDKRDKYPAWTKEEIALVRAWIDQGAKE